MKVVIINTFESSGGAAIAANRLIKALKKSGIEVKMLVRDNKTKGSNTISFNSSLPLKVLSKFLFYYERLYILMHNNFSKKNLFAVSIANTGNDISRNKLIKEADIIHLHWINQGFLSIKSIKKLAALNKPVIWTMHDQWPYTGICHYTGGCTKFSDTCLNCPILKTVKKYDLSYKTFIKKKNYISDTFALVGCSKWIAKEAEKSNLCRNAIITNIPNPIDIAIYNKFEKGKARKSLNLPVDKKLILFGACKVTDERKGFEYMKKACDILFYRKLLQKEDIMIVLFGGKSEDIESLLPYHIHNAGYIKDIRTMINLYNAADLFLIPSLEDNLPNTIMESMACGTPCVGFNTGGIPEMIDHLQNGYVAEYKNEEDLAKGINWVLNEADYSDLSENARKKVTENYREDIIAEKYIKLYNSLLN